MFFDARSLEPEQTLEADICIVGAGAAGIALAMEFASGPFEVIVLESGGFDFEHKTQLLYRGETRGRPHPALEFTRRRQFGGTTRTWFGRCRPLDEIDFQERAYIPFSGWPFSRAGLDPYYARAHVYCGLGEYNYDPAYWTDGKDGDGTIKSAGLETKIFQFSPPFDFGQQYRHEIGHAAHVRAFLHANAIGVSMDEDGRSVSRIRCRTLERKDFQVRAREYILAASALEVTRLLLVSREVMRAGIGNQHDLVGRFFMEHPHIFSGAITSPTENLPGEFFKLNYDLEQTHLGMVKAIGLPEARMVQEQTLNASAFFVSRVSYKAEDVYFSKGAAALIKAAEMFQHKAAPSLQLFHSLYAMTRHARTSAVLLWKIARNLVNRSALPSLHIQVETAPNPDSRVVLSDKQDRLGVNQLSLRWQLTRQDLESYQKFEALLHQGLGRLGFQIRRFRHDTDAAGWPVSMMPAKHHLGTTRMHTDPRRGVVDPDCRVHGVANLYIASSSVFPTSGMANPTLTLLALAIRLADHLKQKLGG